MPHETIFYQSTEKKEKCFTENNKLKLNNKFDLIMKVYDKKLDIFVSIFY